MESLQLTLTKTKNYTLEPFGKFNISWLPSKSVGLKPKTLPLQELSFNNETGMPYTTEDETKFVKMMKKHKTDILIDQNGYLYTRMSNVFVEVSHPKLRKYSNFLNDQNLEDSDEAWKIYEIN